jgi:hypothetical protein
MLEVLGITAWQTLIYRQSFLKSEVIVFAYLVWSTNLKVSTAESETKIK